MRKTVLAIIMCITLSCPAFAEIVTYSDDYVSFDYDSDVLGRINFIQNKNSFSYSASTKIMRTDDFPSCNIFLYIFDETWPDSLLNDPQITIKSEDPLEYISSSDGETAYSRVLGVYDASALIAYLSVPDGFSDPYDAVQLVYDTAVASDNFLENGYSPDELTIQSIYKNVIYSDKAISYARQALNICNGYLDFKLTGDEAEDRIKSIIHNSEDLKDNGEYLYDSDLYYIVSNSDLYFSGNNDARIIDLKLELEEFIGDQ